MYRSITAGQFLQSYYLQGVIVFISLLYSSLFNLFVFDLEESPNQVIIMIIAVPTQISVLFVLWSMVRVIISDPGKVPVYYGVLMDDSETKKRRYCLICHIFKPDRCHHCSTCKRCVLNMDHHCPWIGNCVGYQNRKFFILFLFYITVTVFFALIIILAKMIPLFINLSVNWEILLDIRFGLQSLTLVAVIVFGVMITNFFRFHISLVSENKTTIDTLEQRRNNVDPVNIVNVYDVGLKKNWQQVMGKNKLLWFFPIFGESGRPSGDGVHWEKNQQQITMSEQNQTNRTNSNINQQQQNPQPPQTQPIQSQQSNTANKVQPI